MVDLISEPARIFPAPGYSWPYQNQYVPGQVVIDFTSGTYGDGAVLNTCPQTIVMAMLLTIGHFYHNRRSHLRQTRSRRSPLGVAELLAGEVFETVS